MVLLFIYFIYFIYLIYFLYFVYLYSLLQLYFNNYKIRVLCNMKLDFLILLYFYALINLYLGCLANCVVTNALHTLCTSMYHYDCFYICKNLTEGEINQSINQSCHELSTLIQSSPKLRTINNLERSSAFVAQINNFLANLLPAVGDRPSYLNVIFAICVVLSVIWCVYTIRYDQPRGLVVRPPDY